MKRYDDTIDKLLESEKFLHDLHNAPRTIGHRRVRWWRRVDWLEVGALALICLFGFVAGVIFFFRLTDGRMY